MVGIKEIKKTYIELAELKAIYNVYMLDLKLKMDKYERVLGLTRKEHMEISDDARMTAKKMVEACNSMDYQHSEENYE